MAGIDSISLQNAVVSLQNFLTEQAAQTSAASLETVRQAAVASEYPYPELAAQVFKFLQTKRVKLSDVTTEEVSDAFMTLLLDQEAVEALGAGKAQNPWQAVRLALRNTGQAIGQSLIDVYNTVRELGMGYTPTVLELSAELSALLKQLAATGKDGEAALRALGNKVGTEAWKIALLAALLRRRKKAGGDITDEELEEIFADKKLIAALEKETPEGPWDVYRAQGEALRMLRQFGQGLIELADASDAS
jgi:hypothetical protein